MHIQSWVASYLSVYAIVTDRRPGKTMLVKDAEDRSGNVDSRVRQGIGMLTRVAEREVGGGDRKQLSYGARDNHTAAAHNDAKQVLTDYICRQQYQTTVW